MAITQTPIGTHNLCMCPHTRLVLSTYSTSGPLSQTDARTLRFFKQRASDQSALLLLPLNIHEVSISVTRSEEPCHVFNLWMTRLNHLLCLEKPERARETERDWQTAREEESAREGVRFAHFLCFPCQSRML